ncbi:hemoglobin subunit alpha-5-like [Discoglossus pictus]
MTFSEAEKTAIRTIWGKASSHANDLGAEALDRLFLSYPQTKTYFNHIDTHSGSADLHTHGGKVLNAIGLAASHLDHMDQALSALSDLHAYKLRVDPGNFRLLSHSIQVVLAVHFPQDFSAVAQSGWDKLLSAVSTVLISKYR